MGVRSESTAAGANAAAAERRRLACAGPSVVEMRLS